MADKPRRARINADNGHRRLTRPRLRIIKAETQGYPTNYLRAPSGTVEYDCGSREVGYDEAIIIHGLWVEPIGPVNARLVFLYPRDRRDETHRSE